MTAAPTFPVGVGIRVTSGNLEGSVGTVVDSDGGLPDLPRMVRVSLPGQVPAKWWIDPSNLERHP